jgi:hypothetical protein
LDGGKGTAAPFSFGVELYHPVLFPHVHTRADGLLWIVGDAALMAAM